MALTEIEASRFAGLEHTLGGTGFTDDTLDAYYEGTRRLEQIGLAVPPELRRFETMVNWPRLVVDAVEERCDVKSFMRGGSDVADDELREAWDVNNLDSEFHLTFLDSLIFGRGFLSVGTNEDDGQHPLITVESPREMAVDVDPRTRRVRAALKLYGLDAAHTRARFATLYLPDVTVWLERDKPQTSWVESGRDMHGLGRVPVVPFFNRRRSGVWHGVSEMADAISLTDAAARSLTNLQIAAETMAVPQRYIVGATQGDFKNPDGTQKPVWQAYLAAIWGIPNVDGKPMSVGQFTSSSLTNFHDTVTHYSGLLAGLYGLPHRYFGQNTANPPSADGIRADEARLIKRAERKMAAAGDQIGRTLAMYLRFRDKVWPESGDRIKIEWHDAATPTYAARVDGIQKLTGGKPILSREGGWDELGWSDARKARERAYMESEAADPLLEALSNDLMARDTPSDTRPLPSAAPSRR